MTKLKMNNTTSAEIWFGVKEGIPFGGLLVRLEVVGSRG